jgi:cytochrome oxidase Cu insertion factor (SCO1/SenC/PrrC family)
MTYPIARGILSIPLLLVAIWDGAYAQGVPRRRGPEANFPENFPLKIGDPLPDVGAYDSNGKPFPLRNLRGSYTVLVFGCLT